MTNSWMQILQGGEQVFQARADSPISLDNEEEVLLICEGEVNIFCVSVVNHIFGRRRFVYKAHAGDVLFGVRGQELPDRTQLIATSLGQTTLARIKLADFAQNLRGGRNQADVQQMLISWLEWIVNVGHRLELKDQAQKILDTLDISQLAEFNQAALNRFDELYRYTEAQEQERYQLRAKQDQKNFSWALSIIKTLIRTNRPELEAVASEDALVAACKLIGHYNGFNIVDPRTLSLGSESQDPVVTIADCSNVRVRQIELDKNWWQNDVGPFLGFYQENDIPVAILPKDSTHYEVFDVQKGRIVSVTAKEAAKLQPRAYAFFRPFPVENLSLWQTVTWGLRHAREDLVGLVLVSLAIGLIGLLIPILSAVLFDNIVPSASKLYLIYFVAALVVSAVTTFLFAVAQGAAASRLAGRLTFLYQSAVVDRLLNLPAAFFRKYASGDLAYRAMGVDALRTVLSDGVIMATLSSVFAVVNVAVLFYFNAPLAWAMCGLILLQISYLVVIGYFQFRALREQERKSGEMLGIAYDMLSAIAKLRVAGAELRSFSLWSRRLYEQMRESIAARRYSDLIIVIGSMWDVLLLIVVFSAVIYLGVDAMSAGSFLAFNVALFNLGGAILQGSKSAMLSLEAIPYLKGLGPILQAKPEVTVSKMSPGVLAGRLDMVHVYFRYENQNRDILSDINFSVAPGEHVALVGPSGAGKSTLLRLLLGFESPTQGAIYYDGQDLSTLNVSQIRRQIGVVMQNGSLFPGSILDNIIGSSLLTMEDAWAAAKSCGLDEDIKSMPMGMQTMIGENGGGLSGGQRQRILIARALVRKPRMILFDEATSALDNDTQELVTKSIADMNISRVVIAHRISTIRNADRIYVLQDGKIVQHGTFDSLVKAEGLFANLAKRQIA